MTLFNDIYKQSSFSILSEGKTKDGNIMNVLVPFTQTDVENSNGRIYPRAIMQREVDRVSKDISDGRMLGTADHPKSGSTELDKVSHIVKKMWLEKDGKGWASLSILDTNTGKNLKTIIKAGGKLGISTRGFGTQNSNSKLVNDDYRLTGLDVVANPSYKDGVFSQDNIFESLDLNLSGKNNPDKPSSAAHQGDGHMENKDKRWVNIIKLMFEADLKDGTFEGSLKTYIDENERIVKSVLAVEDGKYADVETALKEMFGEEAVQDLADLRKSKAIPSKLVTSGDVREMALLAKIPAKELAEAINKDNARPAVTEQRAALYAQVQASFGGTAKREKVDEAVDKIMAADIRTERPVPKTLTESEKILEAKKKKKQTRIYIKQQMYRDGFLAGFKREQIDEAIAKRMAQLDIEEMEE